jgi:SnoaL-like domain
VTRADDVEEITRLKARYFRHLDRREWDELTQVLSTGARMDADGFTTDGRDAIIQFLQRVLEGTRTVHHGHMPEIDIDGDRARGIWAMDDYVEFGHDDPPKGLRGYGHYEEEYVREDGAWRIDRLRLTRLRVDLLPGGLPASLPAASPQNASPQNEGNPAR